MKSTNCTEGRKRLPWVAIATALQSFFVLSLQRKVEGLSLEEDLYLQEKILLLWLNHKQLPLKGWEVWHIQ